MATVTLDLTKFGITGLGNVTLNKTLGGTSITVQGEGTATTNLQQGLSKTVVGTRTKDYDGYAR